MKVIFFVVISLLLCPTATFCQTKEIYTNPAFDTLSKDHKLLAILPFDVILNFRPRERERLKPGDLEQMQKREGEAVQSALETYFLKRKEEEGLRVKFQDVGKTNALLARRKWNLDSLKIRTKEELADSLNVDGVISGLLATDKPLSEGSAVAIGILTDGWFFGPTNSGKCTINVHDGNSGELLWKYEKTLSRSLGSDIQTVINAMMRKASRKFPYEETK